MSRDSFSYERDDTRDAHDEEEEARLRLVILQKKRQEHTTVSGWTRYSSRSSLPGSPDHQPQEIISTVSDNVCNNFEQINSPAMSVIDNDVDTSEIFPEASQGNTDKQETEGKEKNGRYESEFLSDDDDDDDDGNTDGDTLNTTEVEVIHVEEEFYFPALHGCRFVILYYTILYIYIYVYIYI